MHKYVSWLKWPANLWKQPEYLKIGISAPFWTLIINALLLIVQALFVTPTCTWTIRYIARLFVRLLAMRSSGRVGLTPKHQRRRWFPTDTTLHSTHLGNSCSSDPGVPTASCHKQENILLTRWGEGVLTVYTHTITYHSGKWYLS